MVLLAAVIAGACADDLAVGDAPLVCAVTTPTLLAPASAAAQPREQGGPGRRFEHNITLVREGEGDLAGLRGGRPGDGIDGSAVRPAPSTRP